MHELARHVLHSSEALSTALNVVGSIIDELERDSRIHPRGAIANDPASLIRHQRSILQFMHNRALALESRLNNEISLAFHITAQHTSLSSARISEAARVDSDATKTISILGLVFLPGTFISAIFSMSFFNYSPGNGEQPDQWHVSDKIWMFWAAAIPVTISVIGVWWLWQRSLALTPARAVKIKSTSERMKDP
ncbi:hypothetical protein CKM354_000632000 [Cercospora kikuchii]|nr:uncharacterized protein CKM354_000632000 [Cercospora kikuchii]GIZ43079.1 hypothetical protein CKM354_000632000 [Cercospora kikuchii]